MESIRNFFQDASNACAYANECGPDLAFLRPGEPFTALFAVAAVCFIVFALNERRIARLRAGAPETKLEAPGAGELKTARRTMQNDPAQTEQMAA